jgi:23S rRNA pseudouridine1911/1915/1917 synthase
VSISVVYEDNHLLVVNKRVGLATMGTASDEPSLAREVQAYLKHKFHKRGNVYLGVVSRLDTVTSGLVVFAKTSKAAARLTTQFRERMVDKWYLAAVSTVQCDKLESDAVATPWFGSAQVCWEDLVWKDDQAHRMRVRRSGPPDDRLGGGRRPSSDDEPTQTAKLAWRLLGRGPDFDVILVKLMTGRKHQIRVQFADRGYPVLGDRKYRSQVSFGGGIALHSWRLQLTHPVTKTKLVFVQDVPDAWSALDWIKIQPDVPQQPSGQLWNSAKFLQFLTNQVRSV